MATVLLTIGMVSPLGHSSLAVSLIICSLPILLILFLTSKQNAITVSFFKYNIGITVFFIFYWLVALFNNLLTYPTYLISITLHQIFFYFCLVLLNLKSIRQVFVFTAIVNSILCLVQCFGGLTNNEALDRLSFIGIMNTTKIEYVYNIPRASGLASEPAHLSYILLPPILYCLVKSFKSKNLMRFRPLLSVIYLMTFSIVAYFQVVISYWAHFHDKLNVKTLFKYLLTIFILVITYSQLSFGRSRINGLVDLFFREETKTSSVYAIESNLITAGIRLRENFILGGGLTSHRRTFDQSWVQFKNDNFDETFIDMNRNDAASLYILLASETGLLGLGLYLLLCWRLITTFLKSKSQWAAMGLIHSVSLILIGIRYGQIASTHIMLNLQIALFCLATHKITEQKQIHISECYK